MNANISMDEKGLSELYRQDALVCKGCRKHQQRVKLYRNIVLCSIVTCGVFVISLFVVGSLSFIQLSNRLDNTNAELKTRIAELERDLQSVLNLYQRSQSLTPYAGSTSEVSDPSSHDVDPLDSNHRALQERRKRDVNQKKRRKSKRKKCKNCLPAVQIEGKGGVSKDDKTDLTGFWKRAKWANSHAKFFDINQVSQNGKVKVVKDGLYLLYAQMTLNGKFKRGYHVKKEPQKTSVASCFSYSNGDDISNNISCPTLTIVKLERGDSIYVEEIDTNSSVVYSNTAAVLGLIRVGD